MIDRLEKVLSNHSDMNDYFGEPILAIFGQLIQAINKGESGKILQLSENAKASFWRSIHLLKVSRWRSITLKSSSMP